ncbi:MAG: ion transporter [Candidatus Kerfeldbacteria bacterium]|nr:ion transporter [Candidatus Kerfeldbacteria bacterium]
MIHFNRQTTYAFLTEPKTKAAHVFQVGITLLVLASIGLFIMEFAYPEFFSTYHSAFYAIELVIVVIFSIEYVLKLWSAPSRLKFIFSFYGIIDLLAILPFFLHLANLSFLRSARLLRLLRITKLFRLAKVMQYVRSKFSRVAQENVVKNITVIITLYFCGHYVEQFFNGIDVAVLPDVILAASVLAVAAMFGFFSVSYADLNVTKTFDRFFIHITTAMLMLPIGMMFLVVEAALNVELEQHLNLLSAAIWLVYAAIVLWDFWNVRRVTQKLIQ